MSDPYDSSVVLFLKCNGAEGGTAVTDEKGHTTTSSTATTTNVHADGYFQQSLVVGPSNQATFASSTDFDLPGDFTIEFRAYTTAAGVLSVIRRNLQANTEGWHIGGQGTAQFRMVSRVASSDTVIADMGVPGLNTWTTHAVVRTGTTVYGFFNGVLNSTYTNSSALSTAVDLVIGGTGWFESSTYTGYIDQLRITKGIARYSNAGYTPDTVEDGLGFITAYIEPPRQTMVAYGGSTLRMTAPTPLIYAGVPLHFDCAIAAPSPTVSGYFGFTATVDAPAPTMYVTMHASAGENALVIDAPKATLAWRFGFGGAVEAPKPTLTMTGTVSSLAEIVIDAPRPTLTANGTVSEMFSLEIAPSTPTLIGYGGCVLAITPTGHPTIEATGITGSVMQIVITAPLYELTGHITAQDHFDLNIEAPMPTTGHGMLMYVLAPKAMLTMIGTATVAVSYEAYAINLKHTGENPVDEVTRYTNFPFTHIVRYQNSYFGANENGLFLLEGTTDYAATPTAIPWAFKTAVTDFGYPEFKTIESAYIGGRLGSAETLTLHAGEGAQTQAYSYTTPRGELAQNYRQKFGKGIRNHRYYALGANGSGELVIDSIDFNVAKLSRRI